jgi:hypothetical protein
VRDFEKLKRFNVEQLYEYHATLRNSGPENQTALPKVKTETSTQKDEEGG